MFNRSKANLVDKFKRHVQATISEKDTTWSLKCRAALIFSREVLAGSPEQYHGSAFVSDKLDKDSHSTYWVAVVANGINVLTTIPAFYFGFSTLGPFGLLLTSALSAGVLKISNESAGAASGAAKGNRFWSSQGLTIFIGLNVLLSVISGIGSELMINRSELSSNLASELINEQKLKLKELKNNPDVQKLVTECENLNRLIAALPENSSERRSAYSRAHGAYNSSQDFSQLPDSKKPVCLLAEIKQSEVEKKYASLEEKVSTGIESDNQISFLEDAFPDIYEAHFSKDERIKSGAEEFRLAFQSFYGRLLDGNFSDMGSMGFSLFMFLLSLITSAGACLMMIAHVCRQDTKLSHNPQVRDAIEMHLAYLEKVIFKGENSTELEDEAFLSPPPIQALKVSHKVTDAKASQPKPQTSNAQVEPNLKSDFSHVRTPEVQSAIDNHIAYIKRTIDASNVITFPASAIPAPIANPKLEELVEKSTSPKKVSTKATQAPVTSPPSPDSSDGSQKRTGKGRYQPAR